MSRMAAVVAVRQPGTCSSRAYMELGKHGPQRRAHKHMAKQPQPRQRQQPGERKENTSQFNRVRRRSQQHAYTAAPVQKFTSFKFAWVKKGGKHIALFIFLVVSGIAEQEPYGRHDSTYRLLPGGGSATRRPLSDFPLFSARFRRVIVVARSHPVLATGPCWHSSSLRHVTHSLHNSEAWVPFRGRDWSSAAEARLKRVAVIGCCPINSDCHVLIKKGWKAEDNRPSKKIHLLLCPIWMFVLL
ncbi:hypothetical protein GOODEAATRI_023817 [Goodea atripinnis]|uniref:Uncharacterized protein n=1 Tax=Goodea atripinnis TaxID=208336 RepID=A0ABV0PGG4_9TELE